MVKYFRLNNLTDYKVINLILRNLYTNTAKFEHIVPLKLLQWFHQFLAGRVFRGEPDTETLFGKFNLLQCPFSRA